MPRVFIQQIVVPSYRIPFFGGVAELAKDFDIEVHASDSVASLPQTSQKTKQFNYRAHPCKALAGNRLWWQSGMELSAEYKRGDILVFNSNPRILSNTKLVISARTRGCKVIAWNHYSSSTSGKVSGAIRKKLTALVSDFQMVYTDGEVSRMLADGHQPSRIKALNNTLDTEVIYDACQHWCDEQQPEPDAKTHIARIRNRPSVKLTQFQLDDGLDKSFNLLFCGRVAEKAKVDQLLRSFAALSDAETIKPLRLWIIGDGPERARLESIARSLGVDAQVSWLGAIYDEVELAPWFLSSDLFVYPGAIGLSLNHAMAYGLPVITHNNSVHHMPEFYYLREGENGFTFDENSVQALASTIRRLLNEDVVTKYSDNALKTIHTEYPMSAMVANFVEALELA